MHILDPNLRDGVHEWRDGRRFVKEGDKLYIEGTDTLAGRWISFLFTSNLSSYFYIHSVSSPLTSAFETLLVSPGALLGNLSSVLLIIRPSECSYTSFCVLLYRDIFSDV